CVAARTRAGVDLIGDNAGSGGGGRGVRFREPPQS
ncbi:MAG TPA: transcriptional regulator, partial [Afipia sp.]|nr:transcriptional regulator [Afipia sp.]